MAVSPRRLRVPRAAFSRRALICACAASRRSTRRRGARASAVASSAAARRGFPVLAAAAELLPHADTACRRPRRPSTVRIAVSGVLLMGRAPIVARGLGRLTLPGVLRGRRRSAARHERRGRGGRGRAESPPAERRAGLALALAAGRLLRRPVHGHPRPEHRQRRAAVDPVEPRLLLARPAVGRRRLRDHVRGLPDARRPGRRPLRPAPAFVAALVLFSLTSLAGGTAPDQVVLVGARAVAGPRRRADGGVFAGDHHRPRSRRARSSTARSARGPR